jgi:hypothetical protein
VDIVLLPRLAPLPSRLAPSRLYRGRHSTASPDRCRCHGRATARRSPASLRSRRRRVCIHLAAPPAAASAAPRASFYCLAWPPPLPWARCSTLPASHCTPPRRLYPRHYASQHCGRCSTVLLPSLTLTTAGSHGAVRHVTPSRARAAHSCPASFTPPLRMHPCCLPSRAPLPASILLGSTTGFVLPLLFSSIKCCYCATLFGRSFLHRPRLFPYSAWPQQPPLGWPSLAHSP